VLISGMRLTLFSVLARAVNTCATLSIHRVLPLSPFRQYGFGDFCITSASARALSLSLSDSRCQACVFTEERHAGVYDSVMAPKWQSTLSQTNLSD
jgi:hypothetical protein